MFIWKIAGRLMMALSAIAITTALTAEAAKAPQACEAGSIVTKLEKGGAQALVDWLKERESSDRPSPLSFQTPANADVRIVCRISPAGMECHRELVGIVCPTAVEVQVPGGGSTVVPVDCTGPNADGNCDCDFEQN